MTAEVGDATEVSVRYRLPDAVGLLASTKRFVSLEVGAMVAMELCERALEGAVLTPERVWLDVIGHLHPSRRGTPGEGLDACLEAFTDALHPVARGAYLRTLKSGTESEGRAADLRERFASILYPIDRASARTSLALSLERAGRRDGSDRHRAHSSAEEGTGPDSLEIVLSGLDDTVLRGHRGVERRVASLEHGPRPTDVARDRFGRFEIFGEIARGGMAQVLLARDPSSPGGRPCVLKRMLPALGRQDSFRQMFKDEARLGLSLEHPNICRTLAFVDVEDQPCIQMEWAAGLTLSEVLRRTVRERRLLPVGFVLRVAEAIVAALAYAHQDARGPDGRPLRVVHRDVSPQNVMIQYDGSIRLLDFGVARSAVQSEHSEGGQIKGKFAYMSPEQSLGLPLDDRSDVFCIGILMHEALAGRPLFDRDDRLATVRALARGDVTDVRELRPDVPEVVSRLVRRALSSNVESRPRMKDMHELVLAARAAFDDPNGVVQEVVRTLDPSWRDWRGSLKAFDRNPRSSVMPLATPISQVTRKSIEQPIDPPANASDDSHEEDTEEDVTALAYRPKELRETRRPPPSVTPEPVDFGLEEALPPAAPRRSARVAVALVAALAGLGAATWVVTGDEAPPHTASPSTASSTNEPGTLADTTMAATQAAVSPTVVTPNVVARTKR